MPPAMVVLHSRQVQSRLLGAGLSKALRNTITIKMVMGIVFFFAGMSIVYVKQRVGLSLAGAGLILVFVPAEFLFGICIDFKGKKGPRSSRSNSTASQARLSQISVKVEDDNSTEVSSSPNVCADSRKDGMPSSRRVSLPGSGVQVLPGGRESITSFQTARFHRTRSAVLRYDQDSRLETLPVTSSATSSPTRSLSSRGDPANPRRFHRTKSAVLQSSDSGRAPGQLDAVVNGRKPDDTIIRGQSLRSKRRRFQRTRSVDVSEDAEEGLPSSDQPQKIALRDRRSLGYFDNGAATSPRKTVRLQEANGRTSDSEAYRQGSQTSWATENYTRFHRIRAAMQAAEVQKARAARAGRPELQKTASLTSGSLTGSSSQLRSTTTIKYETTTTVTLTASQKKVTVRQSSNVSQMSSGTTTDLRRVWSGTPGRPGRGSCPGAAPSDGTTPPWASMAIQTAAGIVTLLCDARSSSTSSASAQGSTESEPKTEDCDQDGAVHREGVVQSAADCTFDDNTGRGVRKWSDSWPDSDSQDSASVGQVFDLRQQSDETSDTG